MRITTRIAAIAFSICTVAALPSYADGTPSATLLGYRCEVLASGETSPGTPRSMILVCQIVDDGTPTGTSRRHSGDHETSSPSLDSLLNLLTILDTARHEATPKRHDAVVPRPTP